MSDSKSVATMSTRDGKYDYVRVRPRKDKDRERDSDKRSSIAGTGGIIVKKHRDSTTSRSVAPSDSASQTCTDTQPQPSNDASSPASADTSPSLRTSSATSLTSRPPLSSIKTPAALQPFLENEAGDTPSLAAQQTPTSTSEVKSEWIGPAEEVDEIFDHSENAATPKPMRRAPSETKGKGPASRSSAGAEGLYENPFLPPQMAGSFLSATAGTAPSESPHIPIPVQSHRQPYPLPPSSPAQTWHDAPSQRSSSVASASRNVTSDPSSTTTYIGHPQPKVIQPQDNPVLLLQRVSSAMPDIYLLMQHFHESRAALGIRESHIRQLEMQKEADARRQDKQIDRLTEELEAMLAKHAAKVERMETKINRLEESKASLQRSLTKEVQSKDDAKASNDSLRTEQKQLALKYLEEREEMAASHSKEKSRLVSDHAASQRALSDHSQAQARIAEANMSARLGELNRLHEHERQALDERRVREKRELEEGHAHIRRDLEDSLTAKVKIIEDERRDSYRMRQAWEKEHDELSRRRDEERARYRKEMEEQSHDLTRKHQKERDEIAKSMEASHAGHQAKSQAIIQEQERALESLSRQAAESNNTVSRLQREAETHKRYTADAQEAFRKLQKENTEMRSALETAQSRHQQQQPLDLPDRTTRRVPNSDSDIENRSRTPSRQRSDPQENSSSSIVKPRSDLGNERGRNDDVQNTAINKPRRDNVEVSKAHWNNNVEKKQAQAQSASSQSQSQTLPRGASSSSLDGGKTPLYKTTSNHETSSSSSSSNVQQPTSATTTHAAKSTKNVTWQP